MKITYIYILLTNTESLMCKTIKQYTQAPYNHASISLDPFLFDLYSFARKEKHIPLPAGFVKESVVNGTFSRFPYTTCALYEIPILQSQKEIIRNKIGMFYRNQKQFKYNLIGLLAILMNMPYERKNAYFCSEFVSELLKDSEVLTIDKPSYLMTPDDFRVLFSDYLIYEGLLQEYPLVKKEIG